jgi:hypothetical protein
MESRYSDMESGRSTQEAAEEAEADALGRLGRNPD